MGRDRFALLVVHLKATPEGAAKRRDQWERAITIAEQHRARTGTPVGIIGDVNSTGFLNDGQGEATFLRERLRRAGMRLLTDGLACSEYFRGDAGLVPNLLDHVAVQDRFPISAVAEVQGYCRASQCRPLASAPDDFLMVSDHCPVVVGAP